MNVKSISDINVVEVFDEVMSLAAKNHVSCVAGSPCAIGQLNFFTIDRHCGKSLRQDNTTFDIQA